MTDTGYTQLLDLACGAFLLSGVLVLARRGLAGVIRVFTAQGVALAALTIVIAVHERSAEWGVAAVGIVALRAVALPMMLRRALADQRDAEARPLVNIPASLLAAAALTLLAYVASQPLVHLAPSTATHAIPIGVAMVLIGLFALTTRRRAVSQVVGFLVVDNGITAVGVLTLASVPLVVELGIALDVLFAVLVLQILATRMREAFGDTDLDELRELRD
ncbi:hypothetical protein F0L68_03485 [Solihabitans fulvus]|uniref:Hydrogenase-4 component E n=1 Tax=Solihabitans fulvus TaxID=1892852 RepID=A0A5B2XSP5_9PSEU|nr:hypothetical protein [Solihabitans fulvus]KAA2265924.1 hypothetical protein F0L68_03485 [Solihabitans fulvus]